MKEEPAATGRGDRQRGTPLSILGFRMGAVVAGGGGALAGRWRGDRRRKSSARGGLEGWPGRRWTGGGECFRGGRGGAPPVAGDGGLLCGRLRGVEVEDEPQALDFVSSGCKID